MKGARSFSSVVVCRKKCHWEYCNEAKNFILKVSLTALSWFPTCLAFWQPSKTPQNGYNNQLQKAWKLSRNFDCRLELNVCSEESVTWGSPSFPLSLHCQAWSNIVNLLRCSLTDKNKFRLQGHLSQLLNCTENCNCHSRQIPRWHIMSSVINAEVNFQKQSSSVAVTQIHSSCLPWLGTQVYGRSYFHHLVTVCAVGGSSRVLALH